MRNDKLKILGIDFGKTLLFQILHILLHYPVEI